MKDLFGDRATEPGWTEVALEPRVLSRSGLARAFWDGEMEPDGRRERWVWLPLAAIRVTENKDGTATVALPETLAQEKGLI